MSALALFEALQDFGSRPSPAAKPLPIRPLEPVAPQPTMEEIIRERVEEAQADVEEKLAAAHAMELDRLRREHAEQMDDMVRSIGATTGETIALRLGEMEERIRSQTSAAAARILSLFLTEEMQKRSVASLADAIRTAMEDRDAVRIDIRGPQLLWAALQASLGDRSGNFSHTEAAGFDLSVSIDGKLLETRLAEWSSVVSGILGPGILE